MWIYSTTTAGTAQASVASTTESGSSFGTTRQSAFEASYDTAESSSSSLASSVSPFESSFAQQGGLTVRQSESGAVLFTTTASYREEQWSGFTRSTTGFTTEENGGLTTSSSDSTRLSTLDSYRSGTHTLTRTVAGECTTTADTTRSVVTTAAGPTTTSTTAAATATTSTTAASTVTSTTYGTAASTTLASPVSLIRVSDAEVTEQAWDITRTVDSAGYVSELGSTFTRRSATLATSSTSYAPSAASTYSTTMHNTSTADETLTLTTTATLTVADTFCPAEDIYPATATSTREAVLLTTETTSATRFSYYPITATLSGHSSAHNTAPQIRRELFTTTVPVTYNLSPTSTSTAALHLTWFSSMVRPLVRNAPPHPTSLSATESAGVSGTQSHTTSGTATTTRSTSVSTSSAEYITVTSTAEMFWGTTFDESSSTYSESGRSTSSARDAFSIFFDGPPPYFVPGFNDQFWTYYTETQEFYSTNGATAFTGGTDMTVSSATRFTGRSTFSSSYESHQYSVPVFPEEVSSTSDSFSSSYEATGSGSFSNTETTSGTTATYLTTTTAYATSASSTGTTTTGSGSVASTSGTSSGSSFSQIEGLSYSYPRLVSQFTAEASVAWSAHAMHPRQGFRHPLGLEASAALYSELSLSPSSSIRYPWAGTQDDSAGAAAPLLQTDLATYEAASSVYSAQWQTSDSRLHYTSGISTTFTTTAGTATLTLATTSATSSRTISFSGAGAMSWFAPQSTAVDASGSRIGGIAAKSEYGAAAYFPPGVRHWTRQSGGTASTSGTSWLTAASVAATSNEGYALPTRSETVRSVAQHETAPDFNYIPGGYTGETARPAVTLSLHPNL